MKRKLAFLGAILLAAFIFTCEGNTYRTHALDEEDQAWIDEAGEALQKIVEEREIMRQTRHRSTAVVRKYIDEADRLIDNPILKIARKK